MGGVFAGFVEGVLLPVGGEVQQGLEQTLEIRHRHRCDSLFLAQMIATAELDNKNAIPNAVA